MYERQLGYLVALAREKHFSRAAEVCCVSQPTLSAAIKNLESRLGVAIIKRGQRFQGFTPEGERILAWARQTLAAWDGLKQEAMVSQFALSGPMRLGSVQTAMPILSMLTSGLKSMHDKVRPVLLAKNADVILQELAEFELDIGLSYLDGKTVEGYYTQPIYKERLILVARDFSALGQKAAITWSELAELPLCLLTPEMMNRRIIERAFAEAGVEANVAVETDSIFALYSQLRCCEIFAVVPHSFLCLSEWRDEFLALPIVPEVTNSIGLVSLNQEPCTPIVAAMRAVIEQIDFQKRVDKFMATSYQAITTND